MAHGFYVYKGWLCEKGTYPIKILIIPSRQQAVKDGRKNLFDTIQSGKNTALFLVACRVDGH